MLTRFEVSGFKNLKDVVVELGPFTCVAGPNGAGKSNLFDAVRLLSALADTTFVEAVASVRASGTRPSADLESVLAQPVLAGAEHLRLAAEMILPRAVVDELGQEVETTSTHVRYEIELAVTGGGRPGLRLCRESLEPIPKSERARYFEQYSGLRSFVEGRKRNAFIAVATTDQGTDVVRVPREGKAGRPREVALSATPRTVLSAIASAEYPTLLAAKQEMLSWRFIALEPSAMRSVDDVMEVRPIDESGAHVPAALFRRASRDGDGVYEQLRRDVSELVNVRGLRVVEDEARQALELRASVGDAPELPARSLSDGTLRFLTLAAMVHAPEHVGLVAMEEPENGIHPAKIGAMHALLRRLAEARGDAPRQVVINTHSPYLVQAILEESPDDVLCAVTWRRSEPEGGVTSSTSFHPLPGTWRAAEWEAGKERTRSLTPVSLSQLFSFLKNPVTEETA